MRSIKLIAPTLAAICLLVLPPLDWSQGGNPPASTKESGRTSGPDQTAVEQTAKDSGGTAEQQIKTLEAQRIAAILKGDTSFLEKYFADDYVAIRGDGKLSTKAQEIENIKSGITKYESLDEHELKIRIYGDTAISNGLFSIKAIINGKPITGDARTTRVWVRQKGNWKLVAFQATRVPPASQ
jgi:ketosteroid isomerase-like protein